MKPVLPDVIGPNLKVVFCGRAAGRIAARLGVYYPQPTNRFWSTLHSAGFTSRLLAPEEFRSLPEHGLGLTDLCKTVAGSDWEIRARDDDLEGLRVKIVRYRPRALALVGKEVARALLGRRASCGLQAERFGGVPVFVLSSPSPAAKAYWEEAPWHNLAAEVGCTAPAVPIAANS